MVVSDGEVIDPSSVAIVPGHDGADECLIVEASQYRRTWARQRAFQI
tara:strand:- start:576 stop:716 length:141 start_codon:yes stop_codon:yes gene_type:complete